MNKALPLLLAVPGALAPFLFFVHRISPLDTLTPGWIWGREFALVGAPFFLAVPIAAWQARRLVAGRLSAPEVACAYALATAAMLSTLVFTILPFLKESGPDPAEVLAYMFPCWLLVAVNALLLARNLRQYLAPETPAEMFLLGAYLPNAVLCLTAFALGEWKHIGAGTPVTIVACIGYVVSIALALRRPKA